MKQITQTDLLLGLIAMLTLYIVGITVWQYTIRPPAVAEPAIEPCTYLETQYHPPREVYGSDSGVAFGGGWYDYQECRGVVIRTAAK